jgi:hypothetical protein
MNETESPTMVYNQPREWLLWTVATAGGWVIGSLLNMLLTVGLSMTGLGDALNSDPTGASESTMLLLMGISLAMLAIVGLSVGAMQWLVLRRHVAGLQRWAVFTALGFALGTFAFWAFMGVGVGLMQWLLLRRDLNKTGWWPVLSAVAWPLGYLMGGVMGSAMGTSLLSNLLSVGLAGVIIGAITGVALLWLLRENRVLLNGLRQEAEQAKR